jgi:ferredoxin
MAQQLLKPAYAPLVKRLNRFPQGAPASDLLFKILNILFSEKEAALVAQLPIKPFTAEKAASIWNLPLADTRKQLDALADRAILLDTTHNGITTYILPPPMAGFFEFSMMRTRGDIDQKLLSELFYQYMNVEEDFIKSLFTNGETQLGRVFVHEPILPGNDSTQVLDYERASEVIRSAAHRGISMCYCRHKMKHVDRDCDAPMDICMTFNNSADSLVRHGFARPVDVSEGLDLLQQAYEANLVQFGENIRTGINFICNCCGCCCEALIAARRFGMLHPVNTTNFLPLVFEQQCTGCGRCVRACPVEAIGLVSANDPKQPKRQKARLQADICLGCGLCVRACKDASLTLVPRTERVITPVDSTHRAVLMAIERGVLQNLVFDNHALVSHRAMAAILGVILKLPPFKQAFASKQLQSRYLESLLAFRARQSGS